MHKVEEVRDFNDLWLHHCVSQVASQVM